jgi:RP/EB family microtubule-associated protein
LKWINCTLKTDVANIEQLGSGSIYCHLLDAAYPCKVPLQKVKWNTQMEVDFISNFKVLQSCFEHLGILKNIDIQRLVRAKYQDNLEFAQWMKRELGPKIALNNRYNPFQRRNWVKIDLSFAVKGK